MVRASLVIVALLLAVWPVMADGTADADAGMARLEASDPRTAIDLFTRAIQSKDLSPENMALTYHRRGMAFYMQGEAGRAILDYTIALWHEDLPKDFRPRTLNNRGLAYEAINHYDAALRDYGLSIRLNSNYAEPYANRGNLRRKFNQHSEAVQDYDMALRNGHPHPEAVFAWQGLALEGLGRRREAADAFRRSLQIDGKFELASTHLSRLEEDRTLSSLLGHKKQVRGSSNSLIVSGQPGVKPAEPAPGGEAWQPQAAKTPSLVDTSAGGAVAHPSADVSPDVGLRPALADAPSVKTFPAEPPPPAPTPLVTSGAIMPPTPVPPPQPQKISSLANGEGGSDVEYSLQLGSFATDALAQAGWSKASKVSNDLLDGLRHSVSKVNVPERGEMYRLYAGSLPDKQSALKLCRTLRDKGAACIVIKR